MTLEQLMSLPEDARLEELTRDKYGRTASTIQNNINFWKNDHPINTHPERQDEHPTGEDTSIYYRSRELYCFQRQIINTKVGMLAGAPITLQLNNESNERINAAFDTLQNVFRKEMKGDGMFAELVKYTSVESKCAVIIFEDSANKIKSLVLKYDTDKNQFYPYFDDEGNMIAFTRKFPLRVIQGDSVEELEATEVYTSDFKYTKIGDGEMTEEKNKFGKIQAVYFDQETPEWEYVKELIDKYEMVSSQFSDVNKRLGNTALVAIGEIESLPKSGDTTVLQVKPSENSDGTIVQGDVKLLEATGASQNIKDELQQKEDKIYGFTYPDLNILLKESASGNISNDTMRLKLANTFVQLSIAEVIFKEGMNRVLSVLKTMLSITKNDKIYEELDLNITFNSILPVNVNELIESWDLAVRGGLTSRPRAVYSLPINQGNEEEILEQIKDSNNNEIIN